MKISGNERHSFVCIDTATQKMLWIDKSGKITREIPEIHTAFDLWILNDGGILFPHYGGTDGDGFTILNPDGTLAMRYNTSKEIFSCQPLENGNVLVGELGQKRIVEVDPKGNIALEIDVPYEGNSHECMRMVRKIGDFYWVVQPGLNKIRKFSKDGNIQQEFSIRNDAFGLTMLPNGNIVYSCMSGAYELDQNGNEVWSLTDADIPQINIRWLLDLQLMPNGNLIFANWMGHNHRDEGIHFFEVNRKKEVIWSFDGRGTLIEPATIYILD